MDSIANFSLYCNSKLTQFQDNALRNAITLLGITLEEAKERIVLHQYTQDSPPFFVVYDMLTEKEITPRYEWLIEGKEMVVRLRV